MNTASDQKVVREPALCEIRLGVAMNKVREIIDTIYVLDLTIEKWNEQLNRAQPHRPGRLVVSFAKHSSKLLDGEELADVEPAMGKMRFVGYRWFCYRLTKKDTYERLADLRVGKTLESDRLVVKLIDGIEEMLKERQFLVDTLNVLSTGMPGKLANIRASCTKRADYAIDLGNRVKLDWSLGAERAEAIIVAQNKKRTEERRQKRLAARAIQT